MGGVARHVVAVTIVGIAGVSSPALAETAADSGESPAHGAASKPPKPLEIGAGAFLQMDLGMICRGQGDVVGCTPGVALAGFQLTPRWRLSRYFSVGVLGAVGWKAANETMGNAALGLRAVRVEGETRFHPLGENDVDPWLGADFGWAALTDYLDQYDPNGPYQGSSSVTWNGARGGLALGVDVRTTSYIALGFELRGAVESFGRRESVLTPSDDFHAQGFGTLTVVSLGVGGTFLAAP